MNIQQLRKLPKGFLLAQSSQARPKGRTKLFHVREASRNWRRSQKNRQSSAINWAKKSRTSPQEESGANGPSTPETAELPFSERFMVGEVLGKGSFGTVHRATDSITGEVVAVKKIMAAKSSKEARNEAHHLRVLQAMPGVVKLLGFFDDCGEHDAKDKTSCIVMKMCCGGDLEEFAKEEGPLSQEQTRAVAAEVLRMIEGCHENGILHLDIKAANLMIGSTASREQLKDNPKMLSPGWLVASDFGTARVAGMGYSSEFLGTPTHWAPEVFGRKYKHPADLWATGTLLYLLHSRRMPFWDPSQEGKLKSTSDILRYILRGSPGFDAKADPLFVDFLKSLLQRDPSDRPTATQALQHPWLAE